MLKFKKVQAKNFMSIGDKGIELNLDNQGLVLVEGDNSADPTFSSNGSGKSTALSTITYALYGETPTGVKADNVVNRNNKKNLSVILEFEKDGLSYRIERYRKHSKNKNKVLFYQGSSNLTQKSTADTDQKIQSVFGIDLLTYMNSIAYGQGDVEVFAKATDKGKKQILENLADIGIYQYAQEIAKDKAKSIQEEIKETDAKISTKDQEIHFLQQSFEQEKQNYESTAKSIKEQKERVSNLEEKYRVSASKKDEEQPKISQQMEHTQKEIDQASTYEVNAELEQSVQLLEESIRRLNTADEQLANKLNSKTKELDNITQATHCPVCGSLLDQEHRKQEIERLNQEITEIKRTQDRIKQAAEVYHEKLKEKSRALQEEKQKAKDYQDSYRSLVDKYQELEKKSYSYDTQLTLDKNNLEQARATLEQLEKVPKPSFNQEYHDKLEQEKEELNQSRIDKDNEMNQYQTLATEVFSNKGIRSAVLDLITPFLNERANYYLSVLSGSDIEILFSTQTQTAKGELRDKFDLTVLNGSGGETYQSNSEGEKKRIDLSISFAIQDLVQSKANIAVNLGIYDECFDGLDAVGCENVIKILQERQKEIPSIFVITHNESLKSLFEKSIRVKKVNGETTLEEKES